LKKGGAFRGKTRMKMAAHMCAVRGSRKMVRQPHPIAFLEVPMTCEVTWFFWKAIRQDVLVHGLSQRAACVKYKLGWHTLKKILAHAEPPGYRKNEPRPRASSHQRSERQAPRREIPANRTS
jgi:hypothetical protein